MRTRFELVAPYEALKNFASQRLAQVFEMTMRTKVCG